MRLEPFHVVACLLQAALCLAVSLRASPAEACSPPPSAPSYYTFSESRPGDGASNVPLDAVLLFTTRGWRIENPAMHDYVSVQDVLTVTVTDLDTGELLSGQRSSWWGAPSGVVWRPNSPLLPNRRYAFVATLQQSAPRPESAEGSTELRGSFSTGEQLSPPIELLGGLEVALESYERDKLQCNSAKCGCDKVGREVATRARVRVPGVQGGSPIGSYEVEFRVTEKTPYRFGTPDPKHKVQGRWDGDTSGEPTETVFPMPKHDASYKPCFAWRVTDPAGNTREGAPVCLKDEVDPPGFAFGCSVARGVEGTRGTAFLVLLGALLTVWRVRRRPYFNT